MHIQGRVINGLLARGLDSADNYFLSKASS